MLIGVGGESEGGLPFTALFKKTQNKGERERRLKMPKPKHKTKKESLTMVAVPTTR